MNRIIAKRIGSSANLVQNCMDHVLYQSPDTKLLKKTKKAKREFLNLIEEYHHFVLYNPSYGLTDRYISKWQEKALNGRGKMFYYSGGGKKYHGMFFKETADSAKFKTLIGGFEE